jgi:ribosomal protein S27E
VCRHDSVYCQHNTNSVEVVCPHCGDTWLSNDVYNRCGHSTMTFSPDYYLISCNYCKMQLFSSYYAAMDYTHIRFVDSYRSLPDGLAIMSTPNGYYIRVNETNKWLS